MLRPPLHLFSTCRFNTWWNGGFHSLVSYGWNGVANVSIIMTLEQLYGPRCTPLWYTLYTLSLYSWARFYGANLNLTQNSQLNSKDKDKYIKYLLYCWHLMKTSRNLSNNKENACQKYNMDSEIWKPAETTTAKLCYSLVMFTHVHKLQGKHIIGVSILIFH